MYVYFNFFNTETQIVCFCRPFGSIALLAGVAVQVFRAKSYPPLFAFCFWMCPLPCLNHDVHLMNTCTCKRRNLRCRLSTDFFFFVRPLICRPTCRIYFPHLVYTLPSTTRPITRSCSFLLFFFYLRLDRAGCILFQLSLICLFVCLFVVKY